MLRRWAGITVVVGPRFVVEGQGGRLLGCVHSTSVSRSFSLACRRSRPSTPYVYQHATAPGMRRRGVVVVGQKGKFERYKCVHQTQGDETRGGHPRPPRGSGVRIADGGRRRRRRRRRRQPWARTCSFPAQAFRRAVGSSVGGDDGSDDFCRHSSFTGSLDRWIADLQAFRSVSVLSRPARMHSTTVAHPPLRRTFYFSARSLFFPWRSFVVGRSR